MTAPATAATNGTPPAPLAHLFRHSLREGRVHPLLHAVQGHRRELPQGAAVGAAPGRPSKRAPQTQPEVPG